MADPRPGYRNAVMYEWLLASYIALALPFAALVHASLPAGSIPTRDWRALSFSMLYAVILSAATGGAVLSVRRALLLSGCEQVTGGWGPEATCGVLVWLAILASGLLLSCIVLHAPFSLTSLFFLVQAALFGVNAYLDGCWHATAGPRKHATANVESLKLEHQEWLALFAAHGTALAALIALAAAAAAATRIGGGGAQAPAGSISEGLELLAFFLVGFTVWHVRALHQKCRMLRGVLDSTQHVSSGAR